MKIIKSCKNCECSLYIGTPGDPTNWRHGCDVVTSCRIETGWLELLDVKDDKVCRQRWEEWKRLALAAGEKEMVDLWNDNYACRECKYLDKDWCLREELPCTVNPYLTVKTGMMGMACMGMGYNDGINQGELFDEAYLF
jgi:hypothetical protein